MKVDMRVNKLENKMVRIEVLIWFIAIKLGVDFIPMVSALW